MACVKVECYRVFVGQPGYYFVYCPDHLTRSLGIRSIERHLAHVTVKSESLGTLPSCWWYTGCITCQRPIFELVRFCRCRTARRVRLQENVDLSDTDSDSGYRH